MPVWPDPLGTYGLMIPSGNSTGDMIVDIFDFSSGGSYHPKPFHPLTLNTDLVSWFCGCCLLWALSHGIVLSISHVVTFRGSVLIKANFIGSDTRRKLNMVGLPKHQLNCNSIADSCLPRR